MEFVSGHLVRLEEPDLVREDDELGAVGRVMPNLNGLEATRRTLAEPPAGAPPRVLILTTFEQDEDVLEALRAGASGFLSKNAPPEDLVEAVRMVAAGEALLAPSATRRIIEEFARRAPAWPRSPSLDGLTERETEVLRGLARGLSNPEIAVRLYVGEATVETHVSNALAKLGLRDRVQAVVFAYESGVVEPGRRGETR